jgi:hypothetical protein
MDGTVADRAEFDTEASTSMYCTGEWWEIAVVVLVLVHVLVVVVVAVVVGVVESAPLVVLQY